MSPRTFRRALRTDTADSDPADPIAKRLGLSRIQERTLRACVAGAVRFVDVPGPTRDNLLRRGLVERLTGGSPAYARWVLRALPLGADVIRQLDSLRAAAVTGR